MLEVKSTKETELEETSKKVVNKIFLIGNGFDLSLNLKTRYEDFLLWYFKRFISKCFINPVRHTKSRGLLYNYHDDELFTYYNKDYREFDAKFLADFENLPYPKIKEFILNNPHRFIRNFNSPLFESIFDNSIRGWVDIEKIYYDLLNIERKKGETSKIEKLNNDLKIITGLLKEYLLTIDCSISNKNEIANSYIHQFISKVKSEDVIDDQPEKSIITEKILFLNFNYTSALSNIINFIPAYSQGEFTHSNCSLNHIHGRIDYDNDDLIFGYGDEMDKDYKEIEDLNDNHYLENFKSFKYNHYPNYRDLLRFVNSNPYQVSIYGHSCGLSDRVMLNEIFEHDNCKSIKIYYYNKQEFVDKNMEISRHFNSNKLMRQRIVDFNENDKIPQVEITNE